VELLLKALWVETYPELAPPRTHGLYKLGLRLGPQWEQEQFAFLKQLEEQYTLTRYLA